METGDTGLPFFPRMVLGCSLVQNPGQQEELHLGGPDGCGCGKSR